MSRIAHKSKQQKRGISRPAPSQVNAVSVPLSDLCQKFFFAERGTFLGGLIAFFLMLPFGTPGLVGLCVAWGIMMAIGTEFVQKWQM